MLLAVCDSDYKFTLVDIGQPGSSSDGGIWEMSDIGYGLQQGKLLRPSCMATNVG